MFQSNRDRQLVGGASGQKSLTEIFLKMRKREHLWPKTYMAATVLVPVKRDEGEIEG